MVKYGLPCEPMLDELRGCGEEMGHGAHQILSILQRFPAEPEKGSVVRVLVGGKCGILAVFVVGLAQQLSPRGWDPSQKAQLQRVLSQHSNAAGVAAPVKIDARHGEPRHRAQFAGRRGRIACGKEWAASWREERGGFEWWEFRQPRNHCSWHVRATPPPSPMQPCGMGEREGNR